jgi:DAACS family dicarboxylate/amino acid:cation (Na+ or H+) symporter
MKLKLHWQIFIAMILGTVFALLLGDKALIAAPLGTIFMRLLKMIIVPLVLTSITTGVAQLGDSHALGRLGAKTLGYYFLSSVLAILVGLTLTNLIQPGHGLVISGTGNGFDPSQLQQPQSLGEIIVRLIPVNPVQAAAQGDILGLIFFSLMFGFAITRLKGKPYEFLLNFFDYSFRAMMRLTRGIIRLAPIGVFGLISSAVATAGFDLFKAVGMYMITIGSGLTVHLFVILPLLIFLFTRHSPIKHFQALAPAMATAFSTSSSGATLPVTMDCVENNVGVSNHISSFTLPLGATINMDGTALYECAGVLFIAQALGIPMTLLDQVTIVMVAFLASVGAAAVPSAGLIMIFIVLNAVGLGNNPQAALLVGTMLAVDRPLDMYRTVVNITSDSIGAAVIAHSEGEGLDYPMAMEQGTST